MKSLFRSFLIEEQGQDLVEYSLLLAFLCLASAALFIGAGGNVQTIWTVANNRLSTAAVSAGS
ncbi:MAG: Flp family type IVb pilin [Acidobacteriota bacterium]|nr:Flp family type IVb pilin [Acidobacteriota bacterium]